MRHSRSAGVGIEYRCQIGHEAQTFAITGHINAHEAGAVEYTGHKVISVPHKYGKIGQDALENYLSVFFADENREHMTAPGMVYISHPTEYGTLYTLSELTALSRICKEYGIPLYLDGARLGYGLMSGGTGQYMMRMQRWKNRPEHILNGLKKTADSI